VEGRNLKAIILAVLAALFFSSTFIINRSISISGGYWVWNGVLRFSFMLPILLPLVWLRGNLRQLVIEMKLRPLLWVWWSFVGFVLFFAPLAFAASFGPSWLVAGTYQITIIAGILMSPMFKIQNRDGIYIRQKIPVKILFVSIFILAGVMLIQLRQAGNLPLNLWILSIIPVIISAFAYPLGNRKMMEVSNGQLDPFQRTLGMVIASMPFWFIFSIVGFSQDGLPSLPQTFQGLLLAITSGIIATILFFAATDQVRTDSTKLAAVEATLSLQVIFAFFGDFIFLNGQSLSLVSMLGLVLIIGGVLLNSLMSVK
jgi:drug/metabolite transporter (DMT)-like permease